MTYVLKIILIIWLIVLIFDQLSLNTLKKEEVRLSIQVLELQLEKGEI
jgi:hypothetical protein